MVEPRAPDEKLAGILGRVRDLGPVLRERALQAERAGRHSEETIADLDATGVFGIGSPGEFGGDELPVRQQLDVITEVSRWDGSCGWIVWAGASTNWIPAGSAVATPFMAKRVVSSPLSAISRTMSHPPTSSPLT